MISTLQMIFGQNGAKNGSSQEESPKLKQNTDFNGMDGVTPPLKKNVRDKSTFREPSTGNQSEDSDYEPRDNRNKHNFESVLQQTVSQAKDISHSDRIHRDYYTRSNSPEKRVADRNYYGSYAV